MPIKSRENLVGAWAFLCGVIISILVGIYTGIDSKTIVEPIVFWILAVLGIIVGYFVADKDVQTFLLASVSVVVVSFAGIQGILYISAIGGIDISRIISSTLAALLVLFVPATIIVAMKTVFSIAKS